MKIFFVFDFLLDYGILFPQPTLEVTVSTPKQLLSDTQLSESNLLTVTVETAYSVPEVWNTAASGPQYSYVAALQVPLTSQKVEEVITICIMTGYEGINKQTNK